MGARKPRALENLVLRNFCPKVSTYHGVAEELRVKGYNISANTVWRIVNCKGKRRESEEEGVIFKKYQPRPKVTPQVIRTINKYICQENVPTHSIIANRTKVSPASVNRVIHGDLGKEKKEKRKVHVLNLQEKKNRMSTCNKLYKNHLAGDKCKWAVTIDESWIRLKYDGHTRSFCYVKCGEKVPEEWVKQTRTLWERKLMVIAVMTYYGTIPLFKVPEGKTMTAINYIKIVLRPLIEKYLIPLFGEDINKLFVHHKSQVHTAGVTKEFMETMKEKYGITFIRKEDIPVKGADCAPLDFFGFGYLKGKVESSKATTLDGLWKKSCVVWSRISPETCGRVYQSWKKRCQMIHERNGSHVEQVKEIHKHKQGNPNMKNQLAYLIQVND